MSGVVLMEERKYRKHVDGEMAIFFIEDSWIPIELRTGWIVTELGFLK